MKTELINRLKAELEKGIQEPDSFVGIRIELNRQAKPIWIKNGFRWLLSTQFELYVSYQADRRRLHDRDFIEALSQSKIFADFEQSKYGYEGTCWTKNYREDCKSIVAIVNQIFDLLENNELKTELNISPEYINLEKKRIMLGN